MPRTIAAIALLGIVVLASWIAVTQDGTPDVVPASAPSTAFSAERAMHHVEALAGGPRPVGTPAHERALGYVEDQLRALGLEPQVQEAVATANPRWGLRMGRVRNVMARLPGLDTSADAPAVLLMAHYDSAPSGPGASDDAVGTAVLLETLRALREAQIPEHDVIALFTDAEEAGLLGAEAFMAEHPWADRVGVVLNFEARGTRGPAVMFETGADNGWLIEHFAEAVPNPVAASYSYEVYRRLPNDTDYTVFRRQGIPGLNFAHIHGAVGYHTREDSVERLELASLQHHGSTALALTRALGDAELPAPEDVPRGDAVYFNPVGSAFVHFPGSWVPILAALIGLAALAVLALALKRGRLGLKGMIGGFFAWLAIVAVAIGLGIVSVRLLFPIFYDFRIWGDGSSVAWKLFGWMLLILGLGGLLYALLRRWVSAAGMAGGGLLLWTLLTLPIAFLVTGASYLFLVPLAFQLLAAGWLFLKTETAPAGAAGAASPAPVSIPLFTLLALAAVVVALLWASTLALVAVGLQYGAVVAGAALVVLLLALLAPQLEVIVGGLPGPRWLAPAVLAVLGLGVIGAAASASGFGPASPRPSSLLYALDADTGEAVWGSFDREAASWVRSVIPEGAEREPLEAFLGHGGDLAQAPAPALDLPAPRIEVLAPRGDTYRARIVPPPGTARLRLVVTPGSAVRSMRVDGAEIPGLDEGRERVAVLYFAPAAEGLEVEVGAEQAPELAAIAVGLGLPDEGRGGPPERPDGLMSTGMTLDTDVILVRTAARLDAPDGEDAEEATGEAGEAEEEPAAEGTL